MSSEEKNASLGSDRGYNELEALRRRAAGLRDRERARWLYDQLRSISADLARRFDFGRTKRR